MTLAWLQGDLTSVAFCWRLDRRDGVALGFTSHDRDLAIDGLLYRAAPGMTPSAISVSDGLEVDTLDISGALTSDAITESDMAAGRWDGAAARLFAVDWTNPGGGSLHLTRGELGDVAIRDGAFSAELRGPTALLEQPVVERTSPECRASLGDRRCRVDLAARMRFARVVAVDGLTITLDAVETEASAYSYGRVDWVTGANSGLSSLIAASDAATIRLWEPAPFPIEAGALVRVQEGCDRSLATCAARFANAVNFRGEPYLPGNDLLHPLSGSLTMTRREMVVARARGCIGARFRPQGRKVELGLDCVGVAAVAYARPVPSDYPLRGGKPEAIAALIEAAGLRPIAPTRAGAGDLLLIAAGPGQLPHLAVLTGEGFVHADAGLRRVIETPGRPRTTILGAWEEQG